MKSWTVDEMLAEQHPCHNYKRKHLTELSAGHERRSLLDVLDMPIADADKAWVGCRPGAFDRQREWVKLYWHTWGSAVADLRALLEEER